MIDRIERLLRERRVLIISGLWLVGILLTMPFRTYFPFDDTYITFRYAANLAHGLGLVWNPGGAHTEGYTNFLYVVLLAPFSAIGVDLMNAGQWLCLMSVLVTAFGVERIVRGVVSRVPGTGDRGPGGSGSRVPGTGARGPGGSGEESIAFSRYPEPGTRYPSGQLLGFFAALLYLADPFTWINALSALETSIFVMFVVLAFDQLAQGKSRGMFLCAMLATLTRPEGGLLVGVCLGAGSLGLPGHLGGLGQLGRIGQIGRERTSLSSPMSPSSPTQPNRAAPLRDCVLYSILPLLVYAFWKLYYFGDLLPNSFHVKVSQHPFSMMNGGGTVKLYYISMYFFAGLAVISFFSHWRSRVIQAMAAWCMLLSFFYTFSNLLQPQYDRFMMSFEACMIMLATLAITNYELRITNWGSGKKGRQFVMRYSSFVFALTLLLLQSSRAWHGRGARDLFLHDAQFDDRYIRIAKIFATIPHNTDITFAWGDAGMLPYYSGMKHIDLVGLNTNEIARAHSSDEVLNYVAKQRPEIIIIPTDLQAATSTDSCRHIIRWGHGLIGTAYPAILPHRGMEGYVTIATLPQSVYDLNVMVDSRSKHFNDIATTLSAAIGKGIVTEPGCCFD